MNWLREIMRMRTAAGDMCCFLPGQAQMKPRTTNCCAAPGLYAPLVDVFRNIMFIAMSLWWNEVDRVWQCGLGPCAQDPAHLEKVVLEGALPGTHRQGSAVVLSRILFFNYCTT